MERSVQILRLELDGKWSADELGQALISISNLYDLRFLLELLREDQRDWERFYEELTHFPPFRHWWQKRFPYWGPGPWAPGYPSSFPPVLDDAQLSQLWQLLEPEERLAVRRINLCISRCNGFSRRRHCRRPHQGLYPEAYRTSRFKAEAGTRQGASSTGERPHSTREREEFCGSRARPRLLGDRSSSFDTIR